MAQTILAAKLSADRCSRRSADFASECMFLGAHSGLVDFAALLRMVNIRPQTPYNPCGSWIPLFAVSFLWSKVQVIHNKIDVQGSAGVSSAASGARPFAFGFRHARRHRSRVHQHFLRGTLRHCIAPQESPARAALRFKEWHDELRHCPPSTLDGKDQYQEALGAEMDR